MRTLTVTTGIAIAMKVMKEQDTFTSVMKLFIIITILKVY